MATVFELAASRLTQNGMHEADALIALESFGGAAGKDIPWADIAPRLERQYEERIDAMAVGYITRTQLCVTGNRATSAAAPPQPAERSPLTPRDRALGERLVAAEDLLRRGVTVIRREAWESGETESEWTQAAAVWLAMADFEREYEAQMKAELHA